MQHWQTRVEEKLYIVYLEKERGTSVVGVSLARG
jgi:hypothetical protein